MNLSVDVTHNFPDFRVDVSFDTPGGVTALFGASGAGKTTVVNAIAGLLRPENGRIALNGKVLLDTAGNVDVPTHQRGVGYVFQEGRLFPHMNVRQNLGYSGRFRSDPATPREISQVVELLGIGALLDRRPGRLSGGEAQRVAIGRALLSKPRILLLDEPLAALDGDRRAEVLPYLARLRDETDLPIVYVSHTRAEVRALATNVVLLTGGRVTANGPVGEVLGRGGVGAAVSLPVTASAPGGDGLTVLDTAAGQFFSLNDRIPATDPRNVTVVASDVVLSSAARDQIAGVNVLNVTVRELLKAGSGMIDARVMANEAELIVRVPMTEAARLKLAPGQALNAIVARFTVS